MGSTSGQQQTTSGTTAPWGPAQPGLQMGINAANSAFQSGVGSQPYTASMVTPFSQYSTEAFNKQAQLARQAQPGMTGAYNNLAALSGQMGTSGLNAMQQQAADWLKPTASGSLLNSENPYLNEVIRRSSGDIVGGENLMASAAGRYGSGGHQGVTDKAIADMAAPLRYQDYTNQQARMDQAIRDYGGLGTTGVSQLTAMPGQLGQAYSNMLAPSDTLRGVGQNYESLMSNQLTDQRRIFDEMQQQPWNQIGLLNAALTGTGRLGGSSSSVASTPGTNRLAAGLGGALGGYTAMGGSPWGGILGGLGGFFS